MRVALISPKGPLYRSTRRHLPQVAALPAADADDARLARAARTQHRVPADRRRHGDVPLDLDADLVGMTVITGQFAARLRTRGSLPPPRHQGGARRPACHAAARGGQAARRRHLHGYAEESWPAAAARFRAGALRRRYVQAPDLDLAGMPFPRRELCARATTSRRRYSRPRVPARMTANSAWRRPPGAASSCRSRWRTWSPTSASSARAASSSSTSI